MGVIFPRQIQGLTAVHILHLPDEDGSCLWTAQILQLCKGADKGIVGGIYCLGRAEKDVCAWSSAAESGVVLDVIKPALYE
jgi:hypothetical protein